MYELKTNTAVRIAVGPLVSPDDGFTAETSIDVTDLSVQIIRINQDGSGVSRTAFTPTASGGNNDMVHVASDDAGMYDLELTAAQLNFLGAARITFYAEDVCLPHWIDINVLSAAYYDFKYGSTAPGVNLTHIGGSAVNTSSAQLGVNVVQAAGTAWGSGAITAGSIASNAITDAKINNGAITADKIANNAIANAKIADNAITAGKIASDAITAAKIANNAITADKIASNAITDAKINNGAITADKIANNAIANAKIADGAISVGKIADNAITAAKIAADAIGASELAADAASEIATAVWGAATRQLTNAQTFNLTGNITGNLSGSVGSVTGAVGSVTGDVTVGTNNDKTGYSLATAPPTAIQIRQEMDSNSTKLANLDAAVSTRLAGASYTAPANGDITAIKGVTDKLDDTLEDNDGTYRFTEAALAEAPAGGGGGIGFDLQDIIDGVLDEKLEDHDGVGTVGAGIAAAGSAGDPWATLLPGAYGNGTAGKIVGDNLNATVSSRLASASYTAPPTVTQVRQEMDSNSTKLANLDAAVSSRSSHSAADVWSAAGRTLTGSVTVGTNNDKSGYSLATAPPTATQIRQEMDSNSTKLANLDTAVSTRLAANNYTAPANADITAIRGVTDKLDGTLEDDGDGTYRFTEDALAEAPVTSAADVWTNATRTLTGTQSFNLTGNITGNLSGSVGSVTGAVGSVTGGVTVSTNNDKTGYSLSTAPPTATQIRQEIEGASYMLAAVKGVTDKIDTMLDEGQSDDYVFTEASLVNAPVTEIEFGVDDIVDGVLDAALSDHEESGSVAAGIAAASNAGDPWATELPGSYGSGTAGKIIGDYVDASISSRLAGESYSAPPTASQIWSNETRTLTGGVTVATNNDKTGYSLSNSQTFNLTGNITGNLSGSVGSVTNSVTVGTNNDKTGYSLSTAPPTATQIRQEIEGASYMLAAVKGVTDKIDTMLDEGEDEDYVFTEASLVNAPTGGGGGVDFSLQDIIDGVLDEKLSDHEEVGSVAAGIATAGNAGDPWATELPGSYGSGTAGKIIGDNIDAAITSRLSSAGYTAPPTTAQIWSNETRTLTAASDSSGVTTLLSRVGESLSFSSGNVNVHVKAKDNIDFGALEKASLNAATPSVTVSDKTGFSLATAPPTVVEVRQEMDSNSTRLANLDATVSSRMAGTSYVAPPSVTAIRQEMDASSSKLANLDATVSSRLAADAYTTPPTATSIRQEMDLNSTKLANLDATVSSRLASSSYTTPPTVTAIRQEIDTNSAKLDVAISTRLAGDAYTAPDNQAIADIKEITDILDSMIEDSSGNRFTTKALEQAPVTEFTVQEIIDGVLDEALLNHQIGGSVGAGISAAGSAGDPWSTVLPGAYPIGTAGYVMGTNLLNPGTGSNVWLYRLVEEITNEPIVGALVLVSSDIAGSTVVATAVTDSRGIVRFNLNSGTYYLWRSHVNFEFDDPDTEVVP